MMTPEHRSEALKIVRRLRKLAPDPNIVVAMTHVENMIRMPMLDILKKVPGKSLAEKAALIGVSRQAIYAWEHMGARPNIKQSKRLAELTGLDAEIIRGKAVKK